MVCCCRLLIYLAGENVRKHTFVNHSPSSRLKSTEEISDVSSYRDIRLLLLSIVVLVIVQLPLPVPVLSTQRADRAQSI